MIRDTHPAAARLAAPCRKQLYPFRTLQDKEDDELDELLDWERLTIPPVDPRAITGPSLPSLLDSGEEELFDLENPSIEMPESEHDGDSDLCKP